MSSGITSYAASKLLDNVLRGQANALPTSLLIRLNSTASTHTASGTELTSTGGYARKAVAFSDMVAASDDNTKATISNTNPLVFPLPTANWNAAAVSFDVLDQAGNRWFWGDMTSTTVVAGIALVLLAGALTVNLQ